MHRGCSWFLQSVRGASGRAIVMVRRTLCPAEFARKTGLSGFWGTTRMCVKRNANGIRERMSHMIIERVDIEATGVHGTFTKARKPLHRLWVTQTFVLWAERTDTPTAMSTAYKRLVSLILGRQWNTRWLVGTRTEQRDTKKGEERIGGQRAMNI